MNRSPNNTNSRPAISSFAAIYDNDEDSCIDSVSSCSSGSTRERDAASVSTSHYSQRSEYSKQERKAYGPGANDTSGDDMAKGFLTTAVGMHGGKAALSMFGKFTGGGGVDDIVDEDDIIGGAVALTQLSPAQGQMLSQMASQASSSAASSAAAGSAAAGSAAAGAMGPVAAAAATAVQATAVVASATAAATAATVVTQNALATDESKLVKDLVVGGIRSEYIHESLSGVKREFIGEFVTSFEEAYEDTFRQTFSEVVADCDEAISTATFDCNILCEEIEWCCSPLREGVVQCPFTCEFVKDGVAVFEVGGALAYEIN